MNKVGLSDVMNDAKEEYQSVKCIFSSQVDVVKYAKDYIVSSMENDAFNGIDKNLDKWKISLQDINGSLNLIFHRDFDQDEYNRYVENINKMDWLLDNEKEELLAFVTIIEETP